MNKFIWLLFPILTAQNSWAGEEARQCTEPRPQVCTQEYAPVCANLAEGSIKTFANGCMACGDARVHSWVGGACEG